MNFFFVRKLAWPLAALAASAALLPASLGLEASEWKNRQTLPVDSAGVVKVALPPATLDLARPNLEDLRVLDAAGREVPYVIDGPVLRTPAVTRAPASFRASLNEGSTQLLIETGTTAPLDSIRLVTPAAGFIKAARVEALGSAGSWETVANGVPLFRQFGAEQLSIPLEANTATQLRVTLDDTSTRPVPITGAVLVLSAAKPAATLPLPARLVRREEFVGESLLALDLGAAHVPLASLEIVTNEPLFVRNVTVAVRELRDETPVERIMEVGSIYRVSAEGLTARARLELPLFSAAPSSELLIHIANGDSPPLTVEEVRVRQRPMWLIFRATEPGAYSVLTGQSQVTRPNYDLSGLSLALKETAASDLTLGAPNPNPGYRAAETLADTPLRGAALDPAAWSYRKPVVIEHAGVQQLELEPDVLAHAEPSFGDLRLLREGAQVPYLLERTSLSRPIRLTLSPANDPKRPRLSRWEIKLPRAGLPLTRLTLTSSTALFQRHVRVTEKFVGERGDAFDRTLAEGEWSKVPGADRPLFLSFYTPPATDTLWLETDNGDNPPVALTTAEAGYPVVRLYFKPEAGPLALYYGNRTATAPRYDLSLVAARILMAEKSAALLGPEETLKGGAKAAPALNAGAWFWGALGLVVLGLLIVVAKLLPKPPVPKT